MPPLQPLVRPVLDMKHHALCAHTRTSFHPLAVTFYLTVTLVYVAPTHLERSFLASGLVRALENLPVHPHPKAARENDVVVGDGVFLRHQGLVNCHLVSEEVRRFGRHGLGQVIRGQQAGRTREETVAELISVASAR